jgi:RNA polymerase sigma-70 factor (ECF subfamily)
VPDRDPRRDPDEAALIERAQAGDEAALEALLSRHEGRILRFARQACGHEADAEDVLQETLLTMVGALPGFRGEAALDTWLFTVARRACLHRRRKAARRQSIAPRVDLDAAEAVADPGPDPERLAEREQLAVRVSAALDALDEKYRGVLVLRDVEGLTAPEVGEVLGLSVAAVKSRLHRARAQLREALTELEPAAAPVATGGCPDVAALYSRHIEGELSPARCAEMERHLAACPSCEGSCEGLRRVLSACAASPTPTVPAPVRAALRAAVREALAASVGR